MTAPVRRRCVVDPRTGQLGSLARYVRLRDAYVAGLVSDAKLERTVRWIVSRRATKLTSDQRLAEMMIGNARRVKAGRVVVVNRADLQS